MHLLVQACFALALLLQSDARNFPQCGTDYKCFAPAINPRDDNMVQLMAIGTEEVSTESTAIMMIHAYNEKHFEVVLEALNHDIESIELSRILPTTLIKENIFSCSEETKGGSRRAVFKLKDKEKDSKELKSPLKCSFEAKSGSPIIPKGIKPDFTLEIISNINGNLISKKFEGIIRTDGIFFCDPMQLKLTKIKKSHAYKKINMHLNDFYCSDKYTPDDKFGSYDYIEYREEGAAEYVKTNLTCGVDSSKGKKRFLLSTPGNKKNEYVEKWNDIDIRCVGDAKYFCDYDPKFVPGEKPMKRTKPNKALGIPSMIECPNSHPFFTIKGRASVSKNNTKFECLNYKGDMMWTMDNDIIYPTYPEVYCTDTKECEKVHSSFLHSGSYINEENLPACHEGGQLWINKESADKCLKESINCLKVDKFLCDTSVGYLAFIMLPRETPLKYQDGSHVFCDYPKTARQVNRKNMETIIICATVSGVGTFIVTLVVMFFVLRRIHRRQMYEMEKLKKIDEAEAQKYRDGKFDPGNLEDDKSNKSKRDSINSGNGTVSTKRSIVEKDKLSVKEKGRGFFSDKNERPLVEIEAPKGVESEIAKAYYKNTKTKIRTDGFPKGYKMEYNPETRPFMEKTIQYTKDNTKYDDVRRTIVRAKEDAVAEMQKEKNSHEQMRDQRKKRGQKRKMKKE